MGASPNESDLSLEQLEALVSEKKRAVTEQKLTRVIEAEDSPSADGDDDAADEQRPSRSPETWRGADGGDRHFESTTIVPLSETLQGETSAAQDADDKKPYTWRDRLLLVGEIVALAAFLAIMGASLSRVRDLNDEYQQAQRTRVSSQIAVPTTALPALSRTDRPIEPTPSPRPQTPTHTAPTAAPTQPPTKESAMVAAETQAPAPTGTPRATATPVATSTKPTEPNPLPTLTLVATLEPALPGVRPEHTDTPEAPPASGMQDVNEFATSTATPSPIPGVPLRIVIPAINVDAPVVQGDSWEDLKLGVGHRSGSANPGETSNVVLSAHNDIYGEIFRYLHKLDEGDLVVVHTPERAYRYEVISNEIVSPSRVDLMDPTDTPILTLISCYPYMLDTHRVVVRALLAPGN